MIYGDMYVIGVQLELVVIYDTVKCGLFNFVIDEQLLPGKGIIVELYPTINDLQVSLRFVLAQRMPDLGSVSLEQIDFLADNPGILTLNAPPLEDLGFYCYLGFNGKEERFFYSTDYGKTLQEQRYPRGTVEGLINSLPKIENIDFCSQEVVRSYEGVLREFPTLEE